MAGCVNGGTANYTDLQSSISGGNPNVNILIGSGYHKETTVFPADFADEKLTFRFNTNVNSNNQRLKLKFSATYVRNNTNLPLISMVNQNSLVIAPNAPTPFNSDGSLNWGPNFTFTQNPFTNAIRKYKSSTNNLISNAIASCTLVPGFEIKSSFGYSSLHVDETATVPIFLR